MYGARLRELRNTMHMTIEDVAKAIEVGRSTYAGYETEDRRPPIQNLIKLSHLYKTSVDYILGLSDERDIQNLNYNVHDYLKKDNLNWNGVPLSDEELKPIHDLLEIVVRDRIKHKIDQELLTQAILDELKSNNEDLISANENIKKAENPSSQ